MKQILILLSLFSTNIYGQTKADKIQVLILGSYHMSQYDNGKDILSFKKQEEVEKIVNQLTKLQ